MRTLLEIVAVLLLGAGSGLLVNAVDDRGLDLGRQYFPRGAAEAGAGVQTVPARDLAALPSAAAPPADVAPADDAGRAAGVGAGGAAPSGASGVDPALAERLASKGLTGIGFDEAAAAWRDPLRELGAIVFVDARAQEDYEQGHIPGALKLDFYQPDADLAALVPLLPGASRIVVYCNGGECEDSESAALLLLGLGADPASLAVYAGGITEWRAQQMPVVTGPFPGDA